jgi:hypothetical protein
VLVFSSKFRPSLNRFPIRACTRIELIRACSKEIIILKNPYYIPSNAEKFDSLYKKIVQYTGVKVQGTKAEWKHIPREDIEALNTEYEVWHAVYTTSLTINLPKDIVARREAKKKASAELRDFVNRYLRFAPVTDEDRTAMGIPVRDKVRTTIATPTEVVNFFLKPKHFKQQEIHFKAKGVESKAKPYGCEGAVIRWMTSDKAATSVEELNQLDVASRTPYVMNFSDAERGKVLSVAMQWMNRKSQKGPLSEIQTAIVP